MRQLGEGAFGSVFSAKHVLTSEERAIKQIPKSDIQDDMKFVHTELEAMLKLDHPNIIKFYEFFEDDRMLYMVTEICSDGDFSDLGNSINDPQEIRLLFRDMMMGVAYCHDLGIAHRDLKFENCLVSKMGQVRRVAKIIDFGLAAIRQPGDKVGQWLNDQLGTRYFVAPEVIDDRTRYGVLCDLWSAGVMIYIVLTDEHPFAVDAMSLDTVPLFRKILNGRLRTEPMDYANIDKSARDLVTKMLVKKPEGRITAQKALSHPWLSLLEKVGGVQQVGDLGNGKAIISRIKSFASHSRFERAVLTLVAHGTTSKEVDDLRETFHKLDTSRTGSLSKDEIRVGLKQCSQKITEVELDQLFIALDANETGRIMYTEWLAATLKPSMVASDSAVKQLYNFFDLEKNGKVTRGELLRVLGDEASVNEVLARGDVAGDDCLSESEFKALIHSIAESIEKRHGRTSTASTS